MKSKLEKVKENIEKLIELNPNGEFKIGRCLNFKEIELFESKNNIKLPEEYIEFVTKIGCFGFGPNEGLLPLNQYNDLRHRILENDLSKEFPFTEKKEDDELYKYDYDSLLNGTILISDCGCGDFEILIVNGEEYGNVWGDYRISCNGMMPLKNEKNEKLSFLDWYNQFLEKQIDYYKNYDPKKIENMIAEIESNRKLVKSKDFFSLMNIFSRIFK
jgi:hypothetical protein